MFRFVLFNYLYFIFKLIITVRDQPIYKYYCKPFKRLIICLTWKKGLCCQHNFFRKKKGNVKEWLELARSNQSFAKGSTS